MPLQSTVVAAVESHAPNPESDIGWYALLRAADNFRAGNGHYPGHFKDAVEEDVPKLKACATALFEGWGVAMPAGFNDMAHEMCRYGAAELHSVAAFMGGVAAQEVIKVITKQYVPINNTYIYNAMTGTSMVIGL